MTRSLRILIAPDCAPPLAGAIPVSMSGMFAGGMDWPKASRAVDRNRKIVVMGLLQQEVE